MKGAELADVNQSRPTIGPSVRSDDHEGWTMRSLSTNAVEETRSAPFHLCQPGTHPGGTLFVEGLRMAQPEDKRQLSPAAPPNGEPRAGEFSHRPVMLGEVVNAFAPTPGGVIIDATLGGGGHTRAILESRQDVVVLGVDRDADAVAASSRSLADLISSGRLRIHRGRFDTIADAVADVFEGLPVVGVLFDLGVSSPQLDRADRGFSYRLDGPLDMRMDVADALTADMVVNDYELDELTDVLRQGGEEQFARRIARAIVAARPIQTTVVLADTVRTAIPAPARRRPGDPAKRTFQAIRMEVNGELDVLSSALDQALQLLSPGGRVVTIAYHSGEDRLIKRRFVDASTGGCVCPPRLPCVCGAMASHRLVARRSAKPSTVEMADNSRSTSARLRIVEAVEPQPTSVEGSKSSVFDSRHAVGSDESNGGTER